MIPGLVLWLDSSKGTVPDAQNPPLIKGWIDQSTHGNSASDNGFQVEPVLITLGYKSFDVVHCSPGGSDRYMNIADDVSLQFGKGSFAFMFVIREPQGTNPTLHLWSKGDATGLQISLDTNTITVATPTASAVAVFPNPATFHTVVVRGPALEIRVDGNTTTGQTSTSDISEVGSTSQVGAMVPNNMSAQVDYLQAIAYNVALTDLQVGGLEVFMKAKYGL